MPSEPRSLVAQDYYQRTSDRFDEYVTALAVGLIAYQASQTTVIALGWNPPTLQMGGLACLLVAAGAGLSRMETKVTLAAAQMKKLHAREQATMYLSAAESTSGFARDRGTGTVITSQRAVTKAQGQHEAVAEYTAIMAPLERRAVWGYRLRNVSFMLGLAAHAVAKLFPVLPAP